VVSVSLPPCASFPRAFLSNITVRCPPPHLCTGAHAIQKQLEDARANKERREAERAQRMPVSIQPQMGYPSSYPNEMGYPTTYPTNPMGLGSPCGMMMPPFGMGMPGMPGPQMQVSCCSLVFRERFALVSYFCNVAVRDASHVRFSLHRRCARPTTAVAGRCAASSPAAPNAHGFSTPGA
jgi:hypothetical protein